MVGKVKRLVRDRGFGFILAGDGSEWFFHRSATLPDRQAFDRLEEGDQVDFDTESSPKGPRATNVERR